MARTVWIQDDRLPHTVVVRNRGPSSSAGHMWPGVTACYCVVQWGAGAEASVSNAADVQFDSLLGFLSTVPKKGGSFGRLQYGET